jgi:hypothetical protein
VTAAGVADALWALPPMALQPASARPNKIVYSFHKPTHSSLMGDAHLAELIYAFIG